MGQKLGRTETPKLQQCLHETSHRCSPTHRLPLSSRFSSSIRLRGFHGSPAGGRDGWGFLDGVGCVRGCHAFFVESRRRLGGRARASRGGRGAHHVNVSKGVRFCGAKKRGRHGPPPTHPPTHPPHIHAWSRVSDREGWGRKASVGV